MTGLTTPVLPVELCAHLLDVAREAVRLELSDIDDPASDPTSTPAPLREPGASFVTLTRNEHLLGCIGTIEPYRALVDDVAGNAAASASLDPRLPAVTWDDFGAMTVKVSVLGPLVALAVSDHDELRRALRPGVDGLLITADRERATFLPSVWEQVCDVDRFVTLLWDKAGLHRRSWPQDLAVFRYETWEFGEGELG
jgi:uncharacterized protein